MRGLLPNEIIALWEKGQRASPAERGLLLLRAAFPDAAPRDLMRLTLGQRDAYLLRLRELTIGTAIRAVSTCSGCGERVEFTVESREIQAADFTTPVPMVHVLSDGELHVRFRSVTLADLIAMRRFRTPHEARSALLRRLLSVRRSGAAVAPETIPGELQARIGDVLAEKDAQSEVRLSLACAGCGKTSAAIFDIVPFFWRELTARARRLLAEIRTIAKAYGWTEPEILRLSNAKRQFYLEAAR